MNILESCNWYCFHFENSLQNVLKVSFVAIFLLFLHLVKISKKFACFVSKSFFPRHACILFISFVMIVCDLFSKKHFSIHLLFNQVDLRAYKVFHDLNYPRRKQKKVMCIFSKLSFTKCLAYLLLLIMSRRNHKTFSNNPVVACWFWWFI